MTNSNSLGYNKGDPSRCVCGRVVAVRVDDKIYVKCKNCKRWAEIPIIKEIKKVQLLDK